MKKICVFLFICVLLIPSNNYASRQSIELRERQTFALHTKKFLKITGCILAIGFVTGVGERQYDQHILRTVKTALDLTILQTCTLLAFRSTALIKNCTAILFGIASIYHLYNLLEIYALKNEMRFQPANKRTVS